MKRILFIVFSLGLISWGILEVVNHWDREEPVEAPRIAEEAAPPSQSEVAFFPVRLALEDLSGRNLQMDILGRGSDFVIVARSDIAETPVFFLPLAEVSPESRKLLESTPRNLGETRPFPRSLATVTRQGRQETWIVWGRDPNGVLGHRPETPNEFRYIDQSAFAPATRETIAGLPLTLRHFPQSRVAPSARVAAAPEPPRLSLAEIRISNIKEEIARLEQRTAEITQGMFRAGIGPTERRTLEREKEQIEERILRLNRELASLQ